MRFPVKLGMTRRAGIKKAKHVVLGLFLVII